MEVVDDEVADKGKKPKMPTAKASKVKQESDEGTPI